MNNYFQENKKNALILLGLFFILLIVMYFLFFQPLSKDLKSTENHITQTENDLELLRVQIGNAEDGGTVQTDDFVRLRYANQLPMTAETEEIILILEEIESVSGSRIENVSFSYDGSIPAPVTEEELEGEESSGDDTTDEVEANDEQVEEDDELVVEEVPVINLEEKPEDLQIITLSISVSSPDYEQFQSLVKEIEKQERMMMVSSMSFQNPVERELLSEEADESINANLTIATFYYENE